MGLVQVFERILERGEVRLDPTRCLRNRHRSSPCQKCRDVCPAGCLSLDGAIRLDRDRCLDCGLCAVACPTGALDTEEVSPRRLLAQVREAGTASFCCRNRKSGSKPAVGVEIPCAGALDLSVILGSVASGYQVHLILEEEECRRCQFQSGYELAMTTVEGARRREIAPGELIAVEERVLARHPARTCPACGATYWSTDGTSLAARSPGDELCPACVKKRDLFSGLLGAMSVN